MRRSRYSQAVLARAALTILLPISSTLALADAKAWDGGGGADHSWHNAANWNPDGEPTSISDVTFGSGITSGLVIALGSTQASANSILISATNPFSVTSSTAPALFLTSGSLTRQDQFGTEGDQSLPFIILQNNATWNVNGSGMLTAAVSNPINGQPLNFTKTGNGTLYLSTAAPAGAITVNQGILRVNSVTASSTSVAGGTELQLAGGFVPSVNLLSAPITTPSPVIRVLAATGIGQITLGGIDPIFVDSGSLSIGLIDDGVASRSWGKNGVGTAILTGANTYNGTTFVNNGVLVARNNASLGTGTANVAAIGTLQLGNNVNLPNPVTLAGALGNESSAISTFSGPITLGGNATFNTNFGTVTVTSAISDNGSGYGITKSGPGGLILATTNSIGGGALITEGEIRPLVVDALPAGALVVQQLGDLELVNNLVFNRSIQIAGQGRQQDGAIYSAGGSNVWSGPVTLSDDAGVGAQAATTLTVSGPISGAFTLYKDGDGTVVLSNSSNSYSALVIGKGILQIANAGAIPAGAPITIFGLGALGFSGNVNLNRPLTLTNTVAGVSPLVSVSGVNTWSGPISIDRDQILTVSADSLTVSGNISGAFKVTKAGAGELILSGANGFSGSSVNGGFLTIASNTALPAAATVDVAAGAAFGLRGNVNFSSGTVRLKGIGPAGEGAFFNASGDNTFGGAVVLVEPTQIGVAAGTTLTLAGGISDSDPARPVPLALVKSGQGILKITNLNSLRGGTIVNGGILSIASDGDLGPGGTPVAVNNGSKLLVTSTTLTGRTFNLNTGSIQVNSGATLNYSGAVVSGGFLRGPGTHAIGANSSFSGVTALSDSVISQIAATTLANFTNAGTFTSNAPLTWDGGFNTGAGRLTVNSSLTTSGFENDGVITINNGASVTNTGSNLASTGGSRITINSGGALNVPGNALDLNGGLLVNNGTITGATNVNFGSLAKGSGVYGAVNVADGGRFSPGNSPGAVTTGTASWKAGGNYTVEMADAVAGAGIGWDLWKIEGDLLIDPSFSIAISSLDANAAGPAANFDPTGEYHWLIARSMNDLGEIDATSVVLDTASFANPIGNGHFYLSTDHSSLYINFSSVPEPASAVLLSFAVISLARRKQNRI
jgi:fibronectin-binding autotransporter adhesin